MGKIAFVFAGQGAQKPGMGKDIAEHSSSAARVFELADQVREGTSKQCFEAEQEVLSRTENTQPCIYTVNLAIAEALKERGITADMVAGYSLGELSALAYAGSFSYEKGLSIVQKRGRLMQDASEKCDTGMAAILKLSDEKVEELCSKYENVFPVNFNCKGQITVAGDKEELAAFAPEAKEAGGLVRILEVSGGFHSPFMKEAAEKFEEAIAPEIFAAPEIPVYSNRTSEPYAKSDREIKNLLVEQISNPIRWKTLIENMIEQGVDTFVEVGPGTALTKMITRISKNVTMLNVCDVETLEQVVERIKNNG